MWQALNDLPWLLWLALGAVLGWFAQRGIWALQDFGRDASATARTAGAELARFLGRLAMVASVLIVLLFGFALLAQHKSGQ